MSTTPAAVALRNEIVFVVDDDEAMRDSLTRLLEGSGYTVRTYHSAEEFLIDDECDEGVGCLILDVHIQGMSGPKLQDHLLTKNNRIPIVFVTGHGDVPLAVSTMKKGAVDFIGKPFDESGLRELVERMLSKTRSEDSVAREQKIAKDLFSRLTTREQQMLERIVAGCLNKQIADDLGISIKTMEAHRANIMEKLNVDTVADLLRLTLPHNAWFGRRNSPVLVGAAGRKAAIYNRGLPSPSSVQS